MPYITKIYQDALQRYYDRGLITDEKLLKGLKDGLKRLDSQLSAWGGTQAAIHTYEVLADEIESQSGVRIESQTASVLAADFRRDAENLKKELR